MKESRAPMAVSLTTSPRGWTPIAAGSLWGIGCASALRRGV